MDGWEACRSPPSSWRGNGKKKNHKTPDVLTVKKYIFHRGEKPEWEKFSSHTYPGDSFPSSESFLYVDPFPAAGWLPWSVPLISLLARLLPALLGSDE